MMIMKNAIAKINSGLLIIVTVLAMAFALIVPSQAGTHVIDGQKVSIQAFTKTATRDCDKITYTIHVYILTDGIPVNVIISDVWPNGLLPATAVTMTGNTSSGPHIYKDSTYWSAQFDTPTGTGPTVTSYTLSFTSTIDPAALSGGDFKMVNQAKIALGKSDPAYERSDDPSVSGQEDKTVLNIPAAEVKACMQPPPPPPPAETKSCLDGKAEVTCGKVYGTYNITIKPNGMGGIVPTSVSITSLTPGVTLSPALTSYPVVGGQVTVTVVGATPGQVLNFDVSGTTAGGGSVDGSDICCNGKITVTIPKDLDCPPPPPHVDIKKYCDPVVEEKGDLKAPGYRAICHIKVTTTGVINFPINITEALSAPGKVKYLSSSPATDLWACAPSPVTAPAPMNCVLPANTMTSPADVSIIDVLVTFPNKDAAKKATNCAGGSYNDERLRKSCTDFHVDEKSTLDIKKVCEPLKVAEGRPPHGGGFTTRCKITVTTTGPVSYPLNVSEVLSGSGSVSFYSSSPASVWTCNPFVANVPTPINCVANGGLNNTASTSEFEFDVAFPNAEAAHASENCGIVNSPTNPAEKSCVKFPVESKIDVVKVCEPASYHKYPVNASTTGIGWVAMCHITVTTTGPQTGSLTVNDNLSGGGAVVSANSSTLPAWNCDTLPNCTINGNTLNQTSSTSVIDVMTVFNSSGTSLEAKNCAAVKDSNGNKAESCTGFPPPPKGDIKIVKVCDLAKLSGDVKIIGYQAVCHITITTTGPQTGTINVGDVLAGAGTLGNATAPSPWTCVGSACSVAGGALNQTSSSTTIDVPVNFPMVLGQIQEAKNCAQLSVDRNAVGESCTPIVIDPPKDVGTRDISKVCDPVTQVPGVAPPKFTSKCHITLTTSGSQTGTILVSDNLTGGGTMSNLTGPAPWVCAGTACTGDGSTLNQTSSTTVFDETVTFATQGNALEAKNCAKITTDTGKESCTGFVIDEGKLGNLTVTKEASYNGSHITNIAFPITVTCGGNVVAGSIQDAAAPYVQGNIPLGTQCSVVEGTAPPTGLCPKGQTESWTTTSTPTGPVTVATPTGTTIAVRNILDCKKDEVGTTDIIKVCEPVTEVVGAINHFESKCHITVTTNGPQSGLINVADSFMGIGSMSAATAPAPWTCTGGACTVNGPDLNQTSSTTIIDVTITFNNSADAIESQNCAEITTEQGKRVCTKFTIDPPKNPDLEIVKTGLENCQPGVPCPFTISITSLGQSYNGNVLLADVLTPNLAWPVTSIVPNVCGSSISTMPFACVANVSLAANTPFTFTVTLNPVAGGTLDTNENCITAAFVAASVPVGPKTPAEVQALGSSGQLGERVESCWKFNVPPVVDSDMYIKKVVVNHAPLPLTGMIYDITSTCTNTTQPTGFAHFSDGQTVLFHHYEAGMTCNLSEVIPTPTTACGNDTPVWTTTYSPTGPIILSPNGETVTVTNTLDCEPVVKGGTTFSVQKEATYNGEPITNIIFPMTVTCGHGNVQSLNLANNETQTLSNLPNGTTCTVVEGTIPNAGLCPKGTTEQWTKTYNPANGVNTTTTQASVIVHVRNLLTCKPIIIIDQAKKCPARTHFDVKSGKCLDDKKVCQPPQVLNVKTNTCYLPRPDCKDGTHWDGRNCVSDRKVCEPPQVLNVKTNTCYLPKPDCPAGTHWNSKRCIPDKVDIVCQKGTHREGDKCVVNKSKEQKCGRRQIKVKGLCIDIPRCPIGKIAVPGTGICIDLLQKKRGPIDGPVQKRGTGIGLPGLF
jgi:Domain of unknown function (DUF5979)